MGFDFMFSVFPVIFGIVFVGILVAIIIAVVKGIGQWSSNNASPVLNVQAMVIAKRVNHSTHMQQMGDTMMPMEDTTYYVTFEVQSGSRMEFHVKGKEYGMLREGDWGELVFQGTRYHGFTRNGGETR